MLCRREQKPNKVKGKAMVEVKTEKKQGSPANTNNRIYKHTTIARPGLARQIGNWVTREQKHEHYPTYRDRRKTGEYLSRTHNNQQIRRSSSKTITQSKI